MATTTTRRGRPKGSGIDDRTLLERITAELRRDPDLKPTTAIRKAGIDDPSAIRRLRDKLHEASVPVARTESAAAPAPKQAPAPRRARPKVRPARAAAAPRPVAKSPDDQGAPGRLTPKELAAAISTLAAVAFASPPVAPPAAVAPSQSAAPITDERPQRSESEPPPAAKERSAASGPAPSKEGPATASTGTVPPLVDLALKTAGAFLDLNLGAYRQFMRTPLGAALMRQQGFLAEAAMTMVRMQLHAASKAAGEQKKKPRG